MSDIKIRPFERGDCEEISSLATKCEPLLVNSPYINIVLEKYFGNSCFVAEIDSKIVGFITGLKSSTMPNVYFLWQVGVHPDFRNQGLSTRLIDEAANAAKKLGCDEIQVSISPDLLVSLKAFAAFAKSRVSDLEEITMEKYQSMNTGKTGKEVFYRIKI